MKCMLLLLPLGKNIDSTIKCTFLEKICYFISHFVLCYFISQLFEKKAIKNSKSLPFFSSRNTNFGVPVRKWCLENGKENLVQKPFRVCRQY